MHDLTYHHEFEGIRKVEDFRRTCEQIRQESYGTGQDKDKSLFYESRRILNHKCRENVENRHDSEEKANFTLR